MWKFRGFWIKMSQLNKLVISLLIKLLAVSCVVGQALGLVELLLNNAGASSEYDGARNAAKALVESDYWHPAYNTRLPQTIYNKFPSKVRVTKFQLKGTSETRFYARKFIFFGSNAENCLDQDKWVLQVSYNNVDYTGNTFQAEVENPNMFSCYGFRIDKALKEQTTLLKRMRMFGPALASAPASDIVLCASGPCKNGGTCTDGVNQFTCKCAPGWNGETCEENINECASGPCKNNGTCTDGVNQFTCKCAPGWNGETCEEDINECASGPCKNNGACNDGVNHFTCICAPGWYGESCKTGRVELDLDNGGASSDWSASYDARKAFVDSAYWHPKSDTSLPQTIYNQFVSNVKVTKFQLQGAKSKADHFPTNFIFFGSNADDCEDEQKWELQVSYKDPVYDTDNTFQAEVENPNMFRCYGFKINANEEGGPYTAIKRIKMYGPDSLVLNQFCDFKSYNSNERWILVQVRSDTSRDGQVWDRGIDDYKNGFKVEGALNAFTSYWIGLDKLHELTSHGKWKLLLLMEWESGDRTKDTFGDTVNPFPREWGHIIYPNFTVQSEKNGYAYNLDAHVKAYKMPNIDSTYGTGMFYLLNGNNPGTNFTAGNQSICSKKKTTGWWYSDQCHDRYHCLNCDPETKPVKALWSTGTEVIYQAAHFYPGQTKMAIRSDNPNCIPGLRQCGCDCSNAICSSHEMCINLIPGFRCDCIAGYRRNAAGSCVRDPCHVSGLGMFMILYREGIAGASSPCGDLTRSDCWKSQFKAALPVFVWYDLVIQSFSPAKVHFFSDDSTGYGTVKKFQFIGSNDDVCNTGSNWTVLCENENLDSEVYNHHCHIDYSSGFPFPDLKFRCLGIKVLEANAGVSISAVTFWRMDYCW